MSSVESVVAEVVAVACLEGPELDVTGGAGGVFSRVELGVLT